MTEANQKQLGNTLWSIADQLRGAMDADDFRDYMLSFLFLRYLSDNYEAAAHKELGSDYPKLGADDRRARAQRLKQSRQDERLQRRCDGRDYAGQQVHRAACECDRSTPKAIGQRAGKQLRQGESADENR